MVTQKLVFLDGIRKYEDNLDTKMRKQVDESFIETQIQIAAEENADSRPLKVFDCF